MSSPRRRRWWAKLARQAALGLAMVGLAMVGFSSPTRANSVRLQAALEPSPIGIEEEVAFHIYVHDDIGSILGNDPIVDFELDNLEVVRGPERRRGDPMRRQGLPSGVDSWVWVLQPQRVGKARVRKIRVRLGSRTFELPSQYIDVLVEAPPRASGVRPRSLPRVSSPPDPPPSPPPERSPPQVRLRATMTPNQPYIGQQFRYRLYLDYQSNVRGIRPRELPEFRGFWVEEMSVGTRPARTVEDGGQRFSRAILLQRALFPLQTGELVLEPAEAQMNVQQPPVEPRGIGLPTEEQVHRRSNRLTLQVRELPALPEEIDGVRIETLRAEGVLRPVELGQVPVGDLDLHAALHPQSVPVDSATTWTLTAHGNGHLQLLPPPVSEATALPSSLQRLPPEKQSEREVKNDVVWQTHSWRFALVPKEEGTFTLPSVRVLYFDPDKSRYRLAASEELTLTVTAAGTPSAESAADSGATSEVEAESTEDVEPRPASRWWWPVVALIALVFALLTRRAEIQARLRGRRQHREQVDQLIQDLTTAFHVRAPRRAVEQAEEAWQRYLVARDLIPEDTAIDEWSRFLLHRKVKKAAVAELETLLDDIRYLRQVPKLADVEAMVEELVRRSREVAGRI